MSTKVAQGKEIDKISVSQKINDFLSKNRKVFITGLLVIVCLFILLVAVTLITENKNNKAFETIGSVESDWETARSAEDKSGLADKENGYIKTLKKIGTANKKSYAGARAYMTIAEVYFSRKDWKNAQEHYVLAANAAQKSYIAGLALFNAGVCADEMGNNDEAAVFFNKAVAFENFNLKPRVLFNIGRIEEQKSNKDAAIASYEKLAEQFPNDYWTSLAKSRIIALQIQ